MELEIEFIAHKSYVNDLIFTLDSTLLLTAGMDNEINIWDTNSWDLVTTLKGHKNSVNSLSINSSNNVLISGSTDKSINIWDLHKKEISRMIPAHKHTVSRVSFSPNDSYFASVSYDTNLKLWNINGEELNSLKIGKGSIFNFFGETKLFTASNDGVITLRSLPSLEIINSFKAHENYIYEMILTNTGKNLITVGYDKQVKFWDLDTNKDYYSFEIDGEGFYQLSISPDGSQLAIGCSYKILLFDFPNGTFDKELPIKPKGVYSVKFSPNGKWIASGSADKKIRVWKVD